MSEKLSPKKTKEIATYWQKTAEHDYEIMVGLLENKYYSGCLFFGHIVLEKILKAFVVLETEKQAPYIHDLVRLQEIANLKLGEDIVRLLKEINNFNIKSRYPDYKMQFYKLCTKEFTKEYFEKIVELYKNLCQEFKRKK